MIDATRLYRVEVLAVDGTWLPALSIGQLERGDVFRMLDASGTPAMDADGAAAWVCVERSSVACVPYREDS